MSALSESLSTWAWQGIEFPGTETRVEWGHDSARHQGYGQRGVDIETTGQKPRAFTVSIPLRGGLRWTGAERLYPETYLRLREALKTPEGYLTHPSYGLVTAHVDTISERIDPMKPDGLDLDVTFTEQRAESQELALTLARAAASADAALAAAAEADAAVSSLSVSSPTTIGAEVAGAFEYLDAAVRGGADAIATFDDLVADLDARLRDSAAAGVGGHAYRTALGRTRAAVLARRAEYLGDTAQTVTLGDTMSLARAAVEAYGDASRAAELASKNHIDDPLFILAGTVLVI